MFLFKEEHVPMIVAGVPRLKTQTRRLHKRRRAVPGALHWAQTKMFGGRFARLKVTRAWQEHLQAISLADIHAEGYDTKQEYFDVFRTINKLDDMSLPLPRLWCYEFECIDVMPLGHAITARLYAAGAVG